MASLAPRLAQSLPHMPVGLPSSSIATKLKSAFKWSLREMSLLEEVLRSSVFAAVVVAAAAVGGRKVAT